MKDLAAMIFKYTIRVLAIELGLALIIGMILIIKDHTLSSFGEWMFWAGLFILVIGVFSVLGHESLSRSGTYQMGLTVGDEDIPNRTNADLKEGQFSSAFLEVSAGVGTLAIIISRLLEI